MSFRKTFPTRPWNAAIAAAILSAAVAGCGFQPLHSRLGGAEAARLAGIRILPISNRDGQILSNFLRDKLTPLGPPRKPNYVLSVKLNETKQSLGVRVDESATRANLKMVAGFYLLMSPENKRLFSGNAQSTSSFNILSSTFATLSAEKDARVRSLRQIADQITTRVSIYLGRAR
jgi:LPS-assembly lipoprotein